MANFIQSIIDGTLETQFTNENQVGERVRTDMGIPNRQIWSNERSTLPHPQNDHIINSHEAWSSRSQRNQLFALDANDSQYNHSYMQYSQIYNINNNYQSQVVVPNGYGEQVVGSVQRYRPEQSMGIQTHQVALANRATTQLEKTINIGYSSRLHQNATPMISSIGPTNANFSQQNPRENLTSGREPRRKEPNEAARNFRVREGRVELPWENRQLDVGEGSSSKRHKTNSLRKEGTSISLAPLQANNAVENSRVQNANNDSGNHMDYRNSLYDPVFVSLGLAIDPHIRLFEAQNARTEKDYHMLN